MASRISLLHKHGIHTSLGRQCGRSSVARGNRFFAYILLIIEFQMNSHKVKKCSPYNFRGIAYFTILFSVLLLSYKPSNLNIALCRGLKG
jgi:hypothetical protein